MTLSIIQRTVFISYRRANHYMARSIYQSLRVSGYDVFLDYEDLESGAFGQNLINQIRARAHFLIILTPSALERCVEPDDWVRKEIETALEERRNIIPLMFDGFEFREARPYLVGRLQALEEYNGLRVHEDAFDMAINRLLTDKFLARPLNTVVHPVSMDEQRRVQSGLGRLERAVSQHELKQRRMAERAYEDGFAAKQKGDYERAVMLYLHAIELHPQYYEAYKSLGMVYAARNERLRALEAYNEAIKISARYAEAYHNRALLYCDYKEWDKAMTDFNQAITLKPRYAYAYDGRGRVMMVKHKYVEAYMDFSKAIEHYPDYGFAYLHRARVARRLKRFDQALSDFNEAIRLGQHSPSVFVDRASLYRRMGNSTAAFADVKKALELDPQHAAAKRLLVELQGGAPPPSSRINVRGSGESAPRLRHVQVRPRTSMPTGTRLRIGGRKSSTPTQSHPSDLPTSTPSSSGRIKIRR